MMFVRGWAVVMIRVIVSDVRMYVQRRPHGRRADQGLDQQTSDEPAHEDSLLRRPVEVGRAGSHILLAVTPQRRNLQNAYFNATIPTTVTASATERWARKTTPTRATWAAMSTRSATIATHPCACRL